MVEQQNTEDNRHTAAETITDINDSRIQVFSNLKDSKAHARDGIFIAEGPEVRNDFSCRPYALSKPSPFLPKTIKLILWHFGLE
jgi:hypothetical protein